MVDHPAYAVTPQTYNYYIGQGGDYTSPVNNPSGPDNTTGNTVTKGGQHSNWGTANGDLVTTSTVIGAIGGGIGSAVPSSDGGSGGGRDHSKCSCRISWNGCCCSCNRCVCSIKR